MKCYKEMTGRLFIILMFFIASCTGDEAIQEIDPDNRPPGAFELIEVANNIVIFDLKNQTFTWEAAVDPDGDAVTYEVYMGTDSLVVDILVGASYKETSFDFNGRFNFRKTYYWKVLAKDGKGGVTESTSVFTFFTRNVNIPKKPLIEQASFPKRFSHGATVHDGRLWVVGGATRNGVTNNLNPYNDVWYSNDGIAWEEATNNADFSPRSKHSVLTFDDKIWVIGGNDGQLRNDVWNSTDGWNWNKVVENAAFPPMAEHEAVVFKDKIWVFYGKEIWNSIDGFTWSQVKLTVPFTTRTNYGVSVMNEKLWIIGGYSNVDDYRDDIWYSDDGETWIAIEGIEWFTPRFDMGTVFFDDSTYIFGGRTTQFLGLSDEIWFCDNSNGFAYSGPLGAFRNDDTSFAGRVWTTCTAFNNKIYMIAGTKSDFDGLGLNDVWVFD